MSNPSPLRIGIVGTGGIAHVHGAGWTAFPDDAVIAAVADINADAAHRFSQQYTRGAASVFGSLDDMLAGTDLDAVDICLPHHLHTDAVISAANAGKAILCEKPLCTTMDDARRTRDAIAASGVVFMSGHNQLFQPSLIEARKLISHGVIGKPFLMRSIETFRNQSFDPFSYTQQPAAGPRGWRTNVKEAGGGELLDTGYHSTYRLLALANNDRPIEVTGFLSRFHLADWPTEDTGQVTVRFESGAVGEILTSWSMDVEGSRQFEVCGSLGALAGGSTFLNHHLYGWPEGARREIPAAATFTAEIGQFIQIIRHGASNPADIDTAIRVLQLIKGAYLSAKHGQTVSLPADPTEAPTLGLSGQATPFSVDVLDDVLT